MAIRSFRDLQVYQESYQLAVSVNRKIQKLPNSEKFHLIDQMRRASRSIPTNIAEAWATKRRFMAEFKRFIRTALGSCHEMEVHIELSRDLNLWPKDFSDDLLRHYQVVGMKLNKLLRNWHKT